MKISINSVPLNVPKRPLCISLQFICRGPMLSLLALVALASAGLANHWKPLGTLYVPSQYPTIQAAIDAAVGGDQIVVAPGTYSTATNGETFPIDFMGKAISVESSNGAPSTIIDASGNPWSVIQFISGETSSSRLMGFTITGGDGNSTQTSDPGSSGVGGGIIANGNASPLVVNCVITNNDALWGGAGVYAGAGSNPVLLNCAIYGNLNGGIWGNQDTFPLVRNTIVRGNQTYEITGTASVDFSNVEGGWTSGANNIDADPLFVDGAGGDFHLLPTSPCIDVGDSTAPGLPLIDFDGQSRITGVAVEIGPDEYIVDCNGNGIHDDTDIASGFSADCDANDVPDECQIDDDPSLDLNQNYVLDSCECFVLNYCTAAPNTVSATGARIRMLGLPSISLNTSVLEATDCPPSQFGIFYYGPWQTQTSFGDGFRCVAGSVLRLKPPILSSSSGVSSRALDFNTPPMNSGAGQINAGSTWNFQYWYRDPTPVGEGFNLSTAVEVTFCP